MRVLFVCTGNTCRSPMAEHLLRKAVTGKGWADVQVESAGTAAVAGAPAAAAAITTLGEAGMDAGSHRSRPLTATIVAGADVILTMKREHKEHLLAGFPQAAGKVFTVGEFVGDNNLGVPDPYLKPLEVYRRAANQLQGIVDRVVDRLQEQRAAGEGTGTNAEGSGAGE